MDRGQPVSHERRLRFGDRRLQRNRRRRGGRLRGKRSRRSLRLLRRAPGGRGDLDGHFSRAAATVRQRNRGRFSDPTGKTAYATFSGFNANTPATPGHVFKTTDGATWTDISGDLPDISTTCIALKGSSIYVGTDIGVFQSDDGGATWVFLDNGLPHVAVFGLDRNLATGDIVASTHGRGMFLLVP